MWRLWNHVFGWDYIAWENTCDYGVARIRKNYAGGAWYWVYKITKCHKKITKADQVTWLTCDPSKYLTEQSK